MLVRVQLDGTELRIPRNDLAGMIGEGRMGPETPVEVDGRWVAARTLPEWDAALRSEQAAARRVWAQGGVPWASAVVVGLCVRVYLWAEGVWPGADVVGRAFDRESTEIVEHGEVWRLLSYGGLHASTVHITSNLLMLGFVAVYLERLLGAPGVFALFTGCVWLGGMLSCWFSPEVPAVGASGADFGFMVAAGVLGWRWADALPQAARRVLGGASFVYAAWTLLNLIRGAEGVDHWCHIGGALAGGLLAPWFRPAAPRRNLAVLGGVVAVIAASFVTIRVAGMRLEPTTELDDDGTSWVRPAWWQPGWLPTGESGWASRCGDATIGLRSLRADRPRPAEEVLAAWSDDVRRLDPAAVIEVAGDGAVAHYRLAERDRELHARVLVRGRFERVLMADLPAGDARATTLDRALDSLLFTPPAEARNALTGETTGSSRLRARAAEAAADLGDLGRADRLIAAARAADGGDPAVDVTELRIAGTWRREDAATRIGAALGRFPDSRDVAAEAARTWAAVGRTDEGLRLLDERLAAAPGDRALTAARSELTRGP